MGYNFDDSYECSVADQIFIEASEKLKTSLKEDIKLYISSLQEDNVKLLEENTKLQNKIREVDAKELELINRETTLEKDFYKNKFSVVLNHLIERFDVWTPESHYEMRDKCNLCDAERKIIFTSPQGDQIKQPCVCATKEKIYLPKKCSMQTLHLNKSDYMDHQFGIIPEYCFDSYDDSRSVKLNVEKIIKEFNANDAETYDKYKLFFASEEACFKYCEWKAESDSVK